MSRAGSVLVLVVALLVLMALIGMAFLSMAQVDRATSIQHENNTEIDLLLDGVVELVKAKVVADVFVGSHYRPAIGYDSINPGGYHHVTGIGDTSAAGSVATPWLASRLPELPQELALTATPSGVASLANPPLWRFVSAPLTGGAFSSPLPPGGPGAISGFLGGQANPPASDSTNSYTQRISLPGQGLYPSFMPLNGRMMPVWVDSPASPTRWMLAADADGDGIPDSGLTKLPIGTINGLTYYAAVRIVDNNAAVNANVAWQHNPYLMTRGAPPLPGDFFPSNIDLLDMLVGPDAAVNTPPPGNINQLLNYRFGQPGSTATLATMPGTGVFTKGDPTASPQILPDNAPDNTTAYDGRDPPNSRDDIAVYPYLEASWDGLGRRLKNPDNWSPGVGNTLGPPIPFSALPIGEAATLARDFVIADPNSLRSTLLPTMLPMSLFQSSPTLPYAALPASPIQWFNQNFNFLASRYYATDPATNTTPVRSILTTENGVTNFCPSKFRDMGTMPDTWPPAGPSFPRFLFGDVIKWRNHRFVCINPTAAIISDVPPVDPTSNTADESAMDNDTWVYQPWTTNPVKTSVNTATFGQLLLAYWSVMAEQPRPSDGVWAPAFPSTPGGSARMFRSPIRVPSPTTWQLSPVQVMQLRAGLAAVNTIDFRDGDEHVTARTVHLTDSQQLNPAIRDVTATVYGLERQPFITKVYATNQPITNSTSAQSGYIAIELYNPDPVRPISLSGYVFATIPRPTTPGNPPNLNPVWVNWGSDTAWFGTIPPTMPNAPPVDKAPRIPNHQFPTDPLPFIVIASSDTPPPGISLPSNVVKPDPTTGEVADPTTEVPLYVVHNLVPPGGAPGALGNELMLFRPRFIDPDGNTGGSLPTSSAYLSGFSLVATPPPTFPGPTLLTALPQNNPYPAYYEGAVTGAQVFTPNPADMVPVDSYDFTGLTPFKQGDPIVTWYYARPDDPAPAAKKAWHFVYPGHYVPANTPRLVDGTSTTALPSFIQMGTFQSAVNGAYKDIPLELNNLDFAGPNMERVSSSGPTVVAFPYGGFARNGDILEVPFIGSYRLEIPDPTPPVPGAARILEINPVTMDSAMALGLSQPPLGEPMETVLAASGANGNDPIVDSAGNSIEHVGRFCPISPLDYPVSGGTVDDLAPAVTPGSPNPRWVYHFATRLFDYLTVQSPQQDYTPEADPAEGDIFVQTQTGGVRRLAKYSPAGLSLFGFVTPVAVANVTGGAITVGIYNAQPYNPNAATEEAVATEGLVNINTSPWRVLAAVPWVPPDFPLFDGTPHGNRLAANVNIGLSIAYYRDVDDGTTSGAKHPHGPFKSIFELNNVPIYPAVSSAGIGTPFTLFRDLLKSGAGPYVYNQDQGNITPGYMADNVYNDFKTKFTMMDRVSNLITTRSDSFTAYVLLQGWRNAETPGATLVVQRRAAFLIDRSSVTAASGSTPDITFVPNQ